MPRYSWRGHLRGVHIHYCPGVVGGDTCEGYIFITARVFLEGTPTMGTYGFHYCPGVLGGDTYDGNTPRHNPAATHFWGCYNSTSGESTSQAHSQKGKGRFRLPREIISDNGKQVKDNPFKDWCKKLNVKQRFASVKHPQTNGQVERANRSLGEGIKARLGEDNRNWVEEVPHVLWAHCTMIKTSNGDTPFSLTYGTEAVIPVEIGIREKAAVREARNKARMAKYYNAKVRSTSFRPGEFVYSSNEASRAKESGKMVPKWEGPYEVVEALGKGAYKLRNGSGDILPRTWNVQDLKKCYL
ncbi:reverse transcriptase domain-containing protein [Tanacetum coccineum]